MSSRLVVKKLLIFIRPFVLGSLTQVPGWFVGVRNEAESACQNTAHTSAKLCGFFIFSSVLLLFEVRPVWGLLSLGFVRSLTLSTLRGDVGPPALL